MNREYRKKMLFKHVECTAYLKEAHDGVHIEQFDYDEDENENIVTEYYFNDGSRQTRLEEPGDGGEKLYYERTEKHFKGVIVGFKDIVVRGRLFLGERRDYKGYTLNQFVGKEPLEYVSCALVYYQNLRKRWVPISDIVLFDEETSGEDQISMDIEIDTPVDTPKDESSKKVPKKTPYIVIEKKPVSFRTLSDDDIPF